MDTASKILLVDDDISLSQVVKEFLEGNGFQCSLYNNAYDAVVAFKAEEFDLCVLDVKMPMMDGIELARTFKAHNPQIPFLFLSGQSQLNDKITGLEAGAEDYIIKPFSMKELLLRVHIILRRKKEDQKTAIEHSIYQIGEASFNSTTREITLLDNVASLSWIECRLLEMFCQAPSGIIDRQDALKRIWPEDHDFRERSLNVYVSKLRKILSSQENISISNIHGQGYQMIIK